MHCAGQANFPTLASLLCLQLPGVVRLSVTDQISEFSFSLIYSLLFFLILFLRSQHRPKTMNLCHVFDCTRHSGEKVIVTNCVQTVDLKKF